MSKIGFTLWFTGLPCSGKTTISDAIGKKLKDAGLKVERLDGDIVRKSLSRDLGFSKEDRDKNIERVTFVSKLLTRNGVITIVSFVSPYRQKRDEARQEIGDFIEIYLRCPVGICESRDLKGMYKKATLGEIKDFTGISDPYEEPLNPELTLNTDEESVSECVKRILKYLYENSYLKIEKVKQELSL